MSRLSNLGLERVVQSILWHVIFDSGPVDTYPARSSARQSSFYVPIGRITWQVIHHSNNSSIYKKLDIFIPKGPWDPRSQTQYSILS